jgi:esterase/lipase
MFFRRFDGIKDPAEAVVLFHGFPSYSSKNEDLASGIASESGITTYTPHFRGLGMSPGAFSFRDTLVDSAEFCEQLTNKGVTKLHLVGHSYGGAVSLLVSSRFNSLASITLLNPLLKIPNSSVVNSIIQQFVVEERSRGNSYDPAALISDMEEIISEYDPISTVKTLIERSISVSCVTSSADLNLDQSALENWLQDLNGLICSTRIPGDHWFTGFRDVLAKEIIKILSRGA